MTLPQANGTKLAFGFRVLFVGFGYFLCSELARGLSPQGDRSLDLCYPAGLLLAALLFRPTAEWWYYLLAGLPVSLAQGWWHGEPLIQGLIYYAGEALQAGAGAWLVRRFVAFTPRLRAVKEVVGVVGYAALATPALVATLVAALSVACGGDRPFLPEWGQWWSGSAAGILVAAPLLLTWLGKPWEEYRRVRWTRWLLGIVTLIGVGILADQVLAKESSHHIGLKYLVLPLVVWAAVRYGARGVSAVVLVVSLGFSWQLRRVGFGEPAGLSPLQEMAVAQIFLCITGVVGFLIAALLSETGRREEDLRASEEKFLKAFEASPNAVLITRLTDGRITEVNAAFVKLSGYEREEAVGASSMSLSLWVDPVERQKCMDVLRREGRIMEHESCFRNKSGGVLDCVISMVELPLENGMHVLTMARDITEQKRVEAELREKRARLELALRSASMGVWERDLKTEKLYWSPELEQMMGFEPGTFPGTEEAYSGLLHPDSLGVYQEAKRRIREQRGSVYQEELRFRLSGGRELWGLVMGKVVQDAQGEPQRLVGILMDLTQRKRLEDQLRHALKLEAIGQLAGGVAHDFNNILAATMMNLSFLLQNPTLDPEIKEVLRELQAEARRAASLTRQLLMFSRRSVLEVKLLDFNEVVANVLKMLGRVIGEQVRIRFHPASVLPLVEADAGMMEQVLMNLSVNARDAMPQGGELTISTETVEVSEERAAANPDGRPGRFVCLSVRDTGCGMDQATLKRLFEPFFTTKDVGKGTGLGLATVYGIVAQHRGWMEVESEPNRGSVFRVFLPASGKMAVVGEGEARLAGVAGGTETILVVEDAAAVRRTVAQGLRWLGYHVLEASSPEEALELWREQGPFIDLLLTDMVMPGEMSGLDLARKLRLENPNLRVILSSGYSAEISQESHLEAEGVLFLPKPYQAEDLGTMVRECLDRNWKQPRVDGSNKMG